MTIICYMFYISTQLLLYISGMILILEDFSAVENCKILNNNFSKSSADVSKIHVLQKLLFVTHDSFLLSYITSFR